MINYQFSTIHYQLFFFALLILIPGCKCSCDDPTDPDCKNYDPCYGEEAHKSGFWMYENVDFSSGYLVPDGFDIKRNIIDLDTVRVCAWRYESDGATIQRHDTNSVMTEVIFECKDERCTNVKWQIGNNIKVLEGNRVNLFFEKESFKTHKVTMIAEYPTSGCNPEESGKDTSVRYLTIKYIEPQQTGWLGRYEGYNTDAPSDIFQIDIVFDTNNILVPKQFPNPITIYDSVFQVRYLPKSANRSVAIVNHRPLTKNFRGFGGQYAISNSLTRDTILGPFMYGAYDEKSKSIEILHAWQIDGKIITKTFKGKKI